MRAQVQEGVNSLTTGTLTSSDIQNHASYDASSLGISGSYGGGTGKNQKGIADNTNPVPGTTLPKSNGGSAPGLQVAPPIAMSASGDASSTTRSGVSGGALTITDGAKQQQLTGQTADETVASINRDTSNTGGALAPIFDKDKIQAGFDITSQFVNQVGTFVTNRAKEADAAKAAANDPNLTPEQRAAAQQRADQLTAEWGPSGTYRQVLTALTVAAGNNVTGGMGQLAQNATIAYVQQLATNQVKQIADSLGSEEARAALHAIVGCAGAAAGGQACGVGAMGAAASSVIGSLMAPTANMSAEGREARDSLVSSLVAGVAAISGQDIATAAGAATIEVENNQVAPPLMAPPPSWLSGFKLPGFTGQSRDKGDNAIIDNSTDLDSSAKAGPLISPLGAQRTVEAIITAVTPDWLQEMMGDPLTMAGYKPNQGGVGNMGAFLDTPGFGSDLGDASQKTRLTPIDGQSVYKATSDVGAISKGDYFYLDGMHKDHLEVFDSRRKFRAVVNMDGSVNQSKTDAGQGRRINVK